MARYAMRYRTNFLTSLLEKLAEKEVTIKSHSRNGKWVQQHVRKVKEKASEPAVLASGAIGGGSAILLGNRGRKATHKLSDAPVYKDSPLELYKKAKPGDVVLVGRGDGHPVSRVLIGAGTGTSDVYHAALVHKAEGGRLHLLDHTDAGYHTSILDSEGRMRYYSSAVNAIGSKFPAEGVVHNISIFRPTNPEDALKGYELYKRRLNLFSRLEGKLLDGGIPQNTARRYIATSYSFGDLVKASYRELLRPLVVLPSGVSSEQIRTTATKALDQMEGNLNSIARTIVDRHNKGLPVRNIIPSNVRSICTTAVTASGIPIHANKPVNRASPGDVWRAKEVSSIGHFRPNAGITMDISRAAFKIAPHAIRGAIGAGLGVSGFFLAKKLTGKDVK